MPKAHKTLPFTAKRCALPLLRLLPALLIEGWLGLFRCRQNGLGWCWLGQCFPPGRITAKAAAVRSFSLAPDKRAAHVGQDLFSPRPPSRLPLPLTLGFLVELHPQAHRIMGQRWTGKRPAALSHLSHTGRPPAGSTGCQR